MSNPNTECVISSGGMRYKRKKNRIEHIWVIENFSSYHDTVLTSPTFPSENNTCNWFLELASGVLDNTRRFEWDRDTWVKLTLKLAKGVFEKYGPVCGNLNVAILNTEGARTSSHTRSFETSSNKSCTAIQNLDFEHRWLLHRDEERLLPNGELRIHCTISYILINDEPAQVPFNRFYPNEIQQFDAIDCEKYFNNEDASDIDIYVGDQKYPAHKFVLAACSPVFKAMFTHDEMIENQQNRIDIQDIDEKTFDQMLRYMYTGKVENIQSVAFELWLLADKYDVEKLKVRCEIEITNMLSMNTAVKTLLFSDAHNLARLKNLSIGYIKGHLAKLKKSEDWRDLTSHQNLLIDILNAQ